MAACSSPSPSSAAPASITAGSNRALFLFCLLLLAGGFSALFQTTVLARAHASRASSEVLVVLPVAAGWLVGCAAALVRRQSRTPRLSSDLGIAALFVASSGPLAFFAFPWWPGSTALAVAGLAGSASGYAMSRAARLLAKMALSVGLVAFVLHPMRLFVLFGMLGGLAVACTRLGLWRGGAVAALPFAVAAVWHPAPSRALVPMPRPGRAERLFAHAALVAVAALFTAADRFVPLAEVLSYPGNVLYASSGQRQRYVITSSPHGIDLFVDRTLRLSSLDAHRYFEALVHPALLSHRGDDRSVLLLEGGSGLAEREILGARGVASLTVVATDAEVARLSGTVPALVPRRSAPNGARTTLVVAEPIVFLEQTDRTFDVIIADLLSPKDHVAGKYYTRYFFQLLHRHLEPGGLLVAPAASATETPQTHAHIVSTVRAAGLSALGYHAPVPTWGHPSFVLAASSPPRVPPGQIASARFANAPAVRSLFRKAPDAQPASAAAATLDRQLAVHSFVSEWTDRPPPP